MNELGLVRYDAMCQAIAVCVRVDEVKDIRDKARAMEVYAAQALNMEAERKAAEIRIRAERRVGELLKEMRRNGQRHSGRGDHKAESRRPTPVQTIKDLGLTRDQSSQWQKLADIPEKEFEAELTRPHQTPTTEGLIGMRAKKKPPLRIDETALQAWGRICDFERFNLIAQPLPELFDLMTPSMRDDVIRITPVVIAWLEHFVNSQRPQRVGRNA